MAWNVLGDNDTARLHELAQQLQLHPLHVEDCLHGRQNAKLEDGADYVFAILKPVEIEADGSLAIGDFDIFLSKDYLVTYEETGCASLRAMIAKLQSSADLPSGQIFYRLLDGVVDSYNPVLDRYSDQIDALEDEVLSQPEPRLLERIFAMKRGLIEMRRVLAQTRDVAGHLLRTDCPHLDPKLRPYFRDVHDHLTRHIETVEMSRDLLSGAMDIYLSSVANRTNQTMKVLALLSAAVLPTLVVASFFGMNFKAMPLLENPSGVAYSMAGSAVATLMLAAVLLWKKWL